MFKDNDQSTMFKFFFFFLLQEPDYYCVYVDRQIMKIFLGERIFSFAGLMAGVTEEEVIRLESSSF